MKYLIFLILLPLLILAACGSSPVSQKLNIVENIIENRPDSALQLLEEIDYSLLISRDLKARYALLKTMAIDKNYIDTTDLSVLRAAVEWYNLHGSPDEKLRTFYYQGRIYDNRNELDSALFWYMKAKYVKGISDSLTFARTLVAQSIIFKKEYRNREYIALNYITAKVFKNAGNLRSELNCLRRILAGSILINDSVGADSIWRTVESHPLYDVQEKQDWLTLKLKYYTTFNKIKEMYNLSDSLINEIPLRDPALYVDLAQVYIKMGKPEISIKLLEEITDPYEKSTFRFLETKHAALFASEQFEAAYMVLAEYLEKYQKTQINIRSTHALMPDQKFDIEKSGEEKEIEKSKKILILVSTVWGGIIVLIVILHLYNLNKNRLRKEKSSNKFLNIRNNNLQLNNLSLSKELEENLEKSKNLEESILNLQNKIREEEITKKELMEELFNLQEESKRLQTLLASPVIMEKGLKEIIRNQLGILNGIIAAEITNKEKKRYNFENAIKTLIHNREQLLQTLYHSFKVSHSKFVQKIDDLQFSEIEKELVYLYAIGLSGQEIGVFLKTSKHYHLSSAIRAKLGLSPSDTNIGNRIREMLNEEE